MMKAAINRTYGLPADVLIVSEIETPLPKDNQVLIKVHASGVNRTDDGFLRAKPFVTRFFSGLIKPKHPILGCEFAGVVAKIGKNVTLFKQGDRVFGFDDVGWGGHGEFMVIDESKSVTVIPKNISFEQAGVSGEGAHYALGYVRVAQKLGAKRVLVHGATGAIGTAAVQLLKHADIYVVATSTTKNVKLVSSLGADKVIDWEKEDFTAYDEVFDLVFDAVGKSSFKKCKPLLRNGGVYIATELGPYGQNPWLGLLSPIYKLFGAKRVMFPLPSNTKEIIEFIAARLEDGTFRPVIDRTYTLDQIVDAYKYVETGQKTGNVAINLELSR